MLWTDGVVNGVIPFFYLFIFILCLLALTFSF